MNEEIENFLNRKRTSKYKKTDSRKDSSIMDYMSNREDKMNSSELDEERQNEVTERMFKQMMTSSEDQNSARVLSDFMEYSSIVGKNYLSFGEKEEEEEEEENKGTDTEIKKIQTNSILENNTTKNEFVRRESRSNHEVEALDTYNECYISDNLCKNANSVHTVEEGSDKMEKTYFHEETQEQEKKNEAQESVSSDRLRKKDSINRWINEKNNYAAKLEEVDEDEDYFNRKESSDENFIKRGNSSMIRKDGSMRRRNSMNDKNIFQREKSMNMKNNLNRENSIMERIRSQDRINYRNEEQNFINQNIVTREKSIKREHSIKRENSVKRENTIKRENSSIHRKNSSKRKNSLKRKGTSSINNTKKIDKEEAKVKYIYKNYSSIPLPQTEKTGVWFIDTINAMLDKLCDINKKDYYLNSLDIVECYPNDDVQYVKLTEQFKVKWPEYLRFSNLIHYNHILSIYEKVFKNVKKKETLEQRSKEYKSQELHSRKNKMESKNIPLPKFQCKHCKDRCALKQYANLPELKIVANEDSKSGKKGDTLIHELWKKCTNKIENTFEEICTNIAEKLQKIDNSNAKCLICIKRMITLMFSFVQNGKYISKVPEFLSVLFGSLYACVHFKKEEDEETVEQLMNNPTHMLHYNKPESLVSLPMQKSMSGVIHNASVPYPTNHNHHNIHEHLSGGVHANSLHSPTPDYSNPFNTFYQTADQCSLNDSQLSQKKDIAKETENPLPHSNLYTHENPTNMMQVNNRTHSSSNHSNENNSNGNISNYPVMNYMDTKEVHPNWESQNSLYYTAASFPEPQESNNCTNSYTKQTTQLQNPEFVDCNNHITDKYY